MIIVGEHLLRSFQKYNTGDILNARSILEKKK